jgi:AcrR family transcriptional regulator
MSDSENAAGPRPAAGDPPSNLHLWKLPRGRHGLPREVVLQSQRERLLAAVVRVTATKGYQASSVADILKEAGVGRETFYKHFKDKEDCFVTANDALVADLENVVKEAYGEPGSWPQRVRRGLSSTLEWFAVSPEIARVMMIEMGTVGPIASSRFRETFRRCSTTAESRSRTPPTCPTSPTLPAAPCSPASTKKLPSATPPTCPSSCPS